MNHPIAKNPYPNRKLPVGVLQWSPRSGTVISPHLAKNVVMLEYGEPELLTDIPSLVGGGDLLNLGDARGGSAILLALGLKSSGLQGQVSTVDCYREVEKQRAFRNMVQAGVSELITQYRGTTSDLAGQFTQTFNFVFIDADHSYEGVLSDFLNYSPKVSENGLIAFHDTNQEWSDRVIRENVEQDWERILWINRIKVFKRKSGGFIL